MSYAICARAAGVGLRARARARLPVREVVACWQEFRNVDCGLRVPHSAIRNGLRTRQKPILRPEYDLRNLRVRRLGPGRKSFAGSVVRIEPDVAVVFPSAEAVNEALRFLIKVAQDKKPKLRVPRSNL